MAYGFVRCLVIVASVISATSALASTAPTWPTSPSLMSLDTPYGTLNIATSEYVYESRLRVDEREIDPPVRGILNITYAFSMPAAQIALVSINQGNNACPVTYRWILLRESGYTVSPEFGSCSPQIRVSASGRLFTMQTPSRKRDKIDIYTYDGKTIKRRTAPNR